MQIYQLLHCMGSKVLWFNPHSVLIQDTIKNIRKGFMLARAMPLKNFCYDDSRPSFWSSIPSLASIATGYPQRCSVRWLVLATASFTDLLKKMSDDVTTRWWFLISRLKVFIHYVLWLVWRRNDLNYSDWLKAWYFLWEEWLWVV